MEVRILLGPTILRELLVQRRGSNPRSTGSIPALRANTPNRNENLMLVDIPEELIGPDSPLGKLWAEIAQKTCDEPRQRYERIGRGLYHGYGLDFGWCDLIEDPYPFDMVSQAWKYKDMDERMKFLRDHYDSRKEGDLDFAYGVCDYPEQVVGKFPIIDSDPRPFIIEFGHITKANDGGWRWHKHGTYIGERDPQYEYLADEPDIDEVWCFHIYQLKEGLW